MIFDQLIDYSVPRVWKYFMLIQQENKKTWNLRKQLQHEQNCFCDSHLEFTGGEKLVNQEEIEAQGPSYYFLILTKY